MKIFLLSAVLVLFQFLTFAQQFQLERTIEKKIEAILDIDGDGIIEYVADTNKVYDGITNNLKYTFPIGYVYWGDVVEAQSTKLSFPHIDFNGDGRRELIIQLPSDQFTDAKVIIYDLFNNQTLFEFDPPSHNANYRYLLDFDGDNELEIIFQENDQAGLYHKFYVYSTGVLTSVLEDTYFSSPKAYELKQNFPNPFNPTTTIRYNITSPEKVSLKIYDVSGQLVNEISKEHNQAGEYEVIWDGKSDFGQKVSSGTYFYQLTVGNYTEAKKMILLK